MKQELSDVNGAKDRAQGGPYGDLTNDTKSGPTDVRRLRVMIVPQNMLWPMAIQNTIKAIIQNIIKAIIDLANPTRFVTFVNRVLPWLVLAAAATLAYGLFLVEGAPDDYQQGATAKIMFIHVPSAWLSMFIWSI